MPFRDTAIEVAAAASSAAPKAASPAMWGGGGAAVVFGYLGSSEAGVIGGLGIAGIGLYFKWREHRMRVIEHKARMARIEP